MHRLWPEQLIGIFTSGPESSVSARLVRICLIVCTVVAVAQLLTMWSTKWGDRHRLGKSFLLSMLVHLCLGLSWASVVESNRVSNTSDPEPAAAPVSISIIEEPREQQPKTRATALESFDQFDTPSERSQQSRPMNEPPALEPTSREQIRQVSVAMLESPEFSTDVARPIVPQRSELPGDQLARSPATSTVIEEVESQVRPENRGVPRSRQESSRVSQQIPVQMSANRDTPRNTAVETLLPPALASNDAPLKAPVEVAKVEVRSRRHPVVHIPDESDRMEKSILQGIVTDLKTGRPLASTTIRFDRAQGKPLVAVTRANGTYELVLPDVPETFAVAASQAGYLPEASNLRSIDVKGKTHRLDFALRTTTEDVIAVENDPVVHHLGNDEFEGVANSKFQRRSEGTTFVSAFTVSGENSLSKFTQPAITFLAKGVQCPPQVRINGHLLKSSSGLSPTNGDYGTLVFPLHSSLLKTGKNEVSVTAAICQGDLDDFEFVNVQIQQSKPSSD